MPICQKQKDIWAIKYRAQIIAHSVIFYIPKIVKAELYFGGRGLAQWQPLKTPAPNNLRSHTMEVGLLSQVLKFPHILPVSITWLKTKCNNLAKRTYFCSLSALLWTLVPCYKCFFCSSFTLPLTVHAPASHYNLKL